MTVPYLCLFLTFCAQCYSGCQALNISNRVVGGQCVDIKNYPYQVSIAFNGVHACGGSILTANYILTAAHCFYGPESKGKHITIRAGSSFRTLGGQIAKIKSVNIHGSFNPDTLDNDVALVQLANPLTLGLGVATIKLPTYNYKLVNGQMAIATGWGFTSNDGDLASQLQMVPLPVITTKYCQNYYGSAITARMVCAGYAAGDKDTCTGDSGGPLVSNDLQIGIVSWGDICAGKNTPGVYTKVSKFVRFIEKIIKT